MIDVRGRLCRHRAALVSTVLIALLAGSSRAEQGMQRAYRQPPPLVTRAFDRSPPPVAEVDPLHRFVLIAYPHSMPSIDQLASGAAPGRLRQLRYRDLRLMKLRDGTDIALQPTLSARLSYPRWSPDGERFLIAAAAKDGVALWIGDVQGRVRRLPVTGLMNGQGHACQWMPDGGRLICVLEAGGAVDNRTRHQLGPKILETDARAESRLASRRWQRRGGAKPAHLPGAQLALVEIHSERVLPLGPGGPISRVRPSPDGSHLMVWTGNERARERHIEVWPARPGASLVLSMPLEGRRLERWQETAPATLYWVEASDEPGRDGGDRLMSHRAPFDERPVERFRTRDRITHLGWIEGGARVLVTEYRAGDGDRRNWLVTPGPSPSYRLLWEERVDSVYDDPGWPLTKRVGTGVVIAEHAGAIFLTGSGATPGGSRPFLDRMDLGTGQTERLWRSAPDRHERVEALVSPDASVVLTSDESPSAPRSFHTLSLADGARLDVTRGDGGEHLAGFTTQILRYARRDGVRLSAMLYLPADRKPGELLPLVMEAYPRTYRQHGSTGEVRVALQQYPVLRRLSALPLAMQGYAVLRNVSMPVVGEPAEANDSFVEQIEWNARAAVEEVVDMGIADPARVGVVGHSYGAFMVATLLVHSDLFRAGVAASGAYNRTLTPFGFQTERRTLWEAGQTYLRMSPFLVADRINEPLLLLHGARDENPGTSPAQSQQLFRAIQANGGTARLVVLPFEGHIYRARESVLHATAEMIDWFNRHLKVPSDGAGESGLRMARGRSGS